MQTLFAESLFFVLVEKSTLFVCYLTINIVLFFQGSSRAEKNRVKRPRNAILDEDDDIDVLAGGAVDTDIAIASVSSVSC